MCGIVGVVTGRPLDVDLASALATLRHRGPDDSGALYWRPGAPPVEDATGPSPCRVAFGHRRLSIIDLTSAGHQPMSSADGRWWIVFNGEVYNYLELRAELEQGGVRFRTRTDTEVVLMALVHWRPEVALKRFRGMFAFGLLDTHQGSVLLARDPFGIKPLFVCHWRDGVAFASETGPLLDLPGVDRALNPERTWLYLRFGVTDHGGDTMLAGIRQVPPGHWGRLETEEPSSDWRFQPFWDPQSIVGRTIGFDDAVEQVRHLFLRNIAWHLRSDVPVGTALSGGIDSSAIVCAIRHLNPDQEIHTFSFLADDARLNEGAWVDVVNRHITAIPHPVRSSADDLSGDLDRLIRCQGEPFGSTSIYAQHRIFRAAREAGITVMLDGQGADEMLGGYVPYQGARLASLLGRGRLIKATQFLRAQRAWPDRTARFVLVTALGYLLPDALRPAARSLVGRSDRPTWANLRWFQDRGVQLDCPWYHGRNGEYLRSGLQESVVTNLLALLRYEDRNSMAYSVESRVPFLTTDLAELLLSLPEDHLIGDDGMSKRVFRAAMRGIVPDVILHRRDKIGFATPELAWLREHSGFVDQALALTPAAPCLDGAGAARYCHDAIEGTIPFSFQTWRLANFLLWNSALVEGRH